MTPEELSAIETRAIAAKEHEYEAEEAGQYFECPLCGSDEVEGRRYDSKTEPATIVAYGIGAGLRAASDWVTHGPSDMLSLVTEVRRLSAKIEEMGR